MLMLPIKSTHSSKDETLSILICILNLRGGEGRQSILNILLTKQVKFQLLTSRLSLSGTIQKVQSSY